MSTLANMKRAITQLTTTGTSTWINLTTIQPSSGSFKLVWVNSTSAIAKFEYSRDGSTVISESQALTSVTNAGTVNLTVPVSVAYNYIRINWVSGTATSLNAEFLGIVN